MDLKKMVTNSVHMQAAQITQEITQIAYTIDT